MTEVCVKFRNEEDYNLCCLSCISYENDYVGSNGRDKRYTYRRGRERIKNFSPKTEGEKQLEKIRHRCKDDKKKD